MNSEINPFDPAFRDDPYPILQQLRQHEPVAWFAPLEAWILTQYQEVSAVLRDPRFSADKGRWTVIQRQTDTFDRYPASNLIVGRSLANIDPPDHSRLRGLVTKAFTPRVVRRIQPRIEQITRELLDRADETGSMDLVQDFARPLPVLVICDLLGLPPEDRDLFRNWSDSLRFLFDPTPSQIESQQAEKAAAEMRDYLQHAVATRRELPRDDLLTGLVAAEEAGDRLSADELFSIVGLLLIAGHETTTALIGNAVWALLQNPDQLHRLQQKSCALDTSIEEFLRYDSPVQMIARVALEDCELAGRDIRRGHALALMLGGANRDPAAFPNPNRLDLSRSPNRHLSFGHGTHFCLGAAVARREASVALGAFVERFPHFSCSVEIPVRRSTLTLRGLHELPLSLR